MKRNLLLLCALSLILMACNSQNTPEAEEIPILYESSNYENLSVKATSDLFLMDTTMNLTVYSHDEAEGQAALENAAARLKELDFHFSPSNPDGELYALNHGNKRALSPDVRLQLEAGQAYYHQSGGLFNIALYPISQAWGFDRHEERIPDAAELEALRPSTDLSQLDYQPAQGKLSMPEGMALDFGALGKGYASDEVMKLFHGEGIQSAIVSLGGNVQCIGGRPDGSPFRVGVINPAQVDAMIAIVEIFKGAIITSGDYQRYF